MMSLFRSSKGQMNNYFAGIMLILVFGLFSFIAFVIYSTYRTGFIASGLYTDEVQEVGEKFYEMFLFHDYLIVLLVVAVILAVIYTSYRLRTTALGYIISFFFGIFFVFISYFMNYFFGTIISSGSFTSYLLYFPRTSMILTNLHWIGVVLFIVGSIALYAKRSANDTEGFLR